MSNIVDFVAKFSAKTDSSFKKASAKIDSLRVKIAEMRKKQLQIPVAKKTVSGINSITKAVGGLAVAVGGFEAVKGFFSLGIQAEQVAAQYEVLLGSASKASAKIAELQKFASETPLNPEEVLKSGKSLVAMGVNVDDLVEKQRMLGDISLATGKNFGELSDIYGKSLASGVIQADELNQISEAGIPIIAELAKTLGVSADKVKKMGSDGKISFNDLDTALGQLTKKGGKYFGMMDKMSKTTAGKWGKLTGSITQTLTKLSGSFQPIINKVIDKMAELWEWMSKNGEIMKILAWSVGIVAVAYGAYTLATWLATTSTTALSVAVGILNVVMALNPVGLIVAGIILLAGALVLAWNKSEKFRQVMFGLWEVLKLVLSKIFFIHIWIAKKLIKAFQDNKDAIMGWMKSAKDAFKSIGKAIQDYIMKYIDAVIDKWNKLKDLFSKSDIGKKTAEIARGIKDKIVITYKDGKGRSRYRDYAEKRKKLVENAKATGAGTTSTGTKTTSPPLPPGSDGLSKNVDNRAQGVRDETKNISINIGTLGDFTSSTISTDNIQEFGDQLMRELMRVANAGNAI